MYMILYATKPQMKLHESTCTPKHWTVNTQLGTHNFMHTQIVHYTYYVSYSIKIRIKALNLVWRRQRNANTSVGYTQHSNGSYLLLTVLNVKCFGCDKKTVFHSFDGPDLCECPQKHNAHLDMWFNIIANISESKCEDRSL